MPKKAGSDGSVVHAARRMPSLPACCSVRKFQGRCRSVVVSRVVRPRPNQQLRQSKKMTSNARSSMAQSRYRVPGYLLPLVLGPLLRTSQVVADAASPTWRLFVLLVTALLAISAPAAAREPAPRAIIVLAPYLVADSRHRHQSGYRPSGFEI